MSSPECTNIVTKQRQYPQCSAAGLIHTLGHHHLSTTNIRPKTPTTTTTTVSCVLKREKNHGIIRQGPAPPPFRRRKRSMGEEVAERSGDRCPSLDSMVSGWGTYKLAPYKWLPSEQLTYPNLGLKGKSSSKCI